MAGVRIDVTVQPKASRNAVVLENEGSLRIYVTAAPEGGKANKVVIALLAKRLRIAKTSIRILRGHRSKHKVLLLEDLSSTRDVNVRLGATAHSSGRGE